MITNIRRATKQDIPALCEIWKACFSDAEEYIKYFYSENFERIEVLVCCIDEKPVSILHFFDAAFVNKGGSQSAKYMYAGGTLPEYRKRGCLGELLEYAKKRADKTGDALFFKPVSPSLVGYFSKHGFEIDSHFRVLTLQPENKAQISACDISFSEYNRMRNLAFSEIPYVKWGDDHLRWCVDENEYFAGRTLKITLDGKPYFLMGYPEDGTLIINETNLSAAELKKASGALCKLFSTEKIRAYMPDSCNEGEEIISSFVYNTPLQNSYVNLILI